MPGPAPAFVTEKAPLSVDADPLNGSVRPLPDPPDAAIVTVWPDALI